MIWAVFDTNTDFTAGENGLQPAPLLGSHYRSICPILGVIFYTRVHEK